MRISAPACSLPLALSAHTSPDSEPVQGNSSIRHCWIPQLPSRSWSRPPFWPVGNLRALSARRTAEMLRTVPFASWTAISLSPPTVRIFVYYHECGHHSVGASELGADSWAVNRGVSEGWLDRSGLQQVCRSFGNMPRTPTHPSSRSRCRNLERVYAKALASKAPLPSRKPVEQANAVNPTLVSGPKLIGAGSTEPGKTASSRRRPANRWRCGS